MSLSLAELVALVQDQIQKSFEYAEHMSVVGRDSDQSALRMNLSEAEVDLPIEYDLEEADVSSEQMKELLTEGSSIEVANRLLSLPGLNKEFEFALKDRMTIDKVGRNHFEEQGPVSKHTRRKKLKSDETTDLTLLEMLNNVHAERVQNLHWDELESRKYVTITAANLSPNEASVEKQGNFIGRISLKFKVVSK